MTNPAVLAQNYKKHQEYQWFRQAKSGAPFRSQRPILPAHIAALRQWLAQRVAANTPNEAYHDFHEFSPRTLGFFLSLNAGRRSKGGRIAVTRDPSARGLRANKLESPLE
jgi:hypothetical protein